MAKKKGNKQGQPKPKSEEKISLGDVLGSDILSKLKETQSALKAEEARKQEEEQARLKEERRQREKNKSFEELLNESSMKWSDYK